MPAGCAQGCTFPPESTGRVSHSGGVAPVSGPEPGKAKKEVSSFRLYPPPPSGQRRDGEPPGRQGAVTACAVTSL